MPSDPNELAPLITGSDLIRHELNGKRVQILGKVVNWNGTMLQVEADEKMFDVRLAPGYTQPSQYMFFSGVLHMNPVGGSSLATLHCDGTSCFLGPLAPTHADAYKETVALQRRFPNIFGDPFHG
eukprot:TRINITY_DN34439_c0_g1_i1.p1 TRINITY_DN34439_c0_g1~~TRINITY_DN34439_c0_g1_i1.p1  ORF type:complete len:139 (+),score=35.11 TRINITY_DN34439_c0_g1_i1:44-418(+)